MTDFYVSIMFDPLTAPRPIHEIFRERMDRELHALNRLVRQGLPRGLWGRERYWFKRLRRFIRAHGDGENERRFIIQMEARVRTGEMELVRDRRHPNGCRFERCKSCKAFS